MVHSYKERGVQEDCDSGGRRALDALQTETATAATAICAWSSGLTLSFHMAALRPERLSSVTEQHLRVDLSAAPFGQARLTRQWIPLHLVSSPQSHLLDSAGPDLSHAFRQ
jgi:hypothetical protein